jgi:hypothetical protein
MTGFRESEMVAICTDVHPNAVLPFAVNECTGYYDKNRPSWAVMEKFALDVVPSPLKPVGFKVGIGFERESTLRKPAEDEDDD